MTFTLSGTTITQTGTDTDLSGLTGIAGVDVVSHGSGAGEFVTYSIESLRLSIGGDLTIDPTNEILVFGNSAPDQTVNVISGGTLNLGKEVTVNGHTYQTEGTGLVVPDATKGACCTGQSMRINAGGTLNHFGATLQIAGCYQWEAGSTVNVVNGKIEATRGSLFRIRTQSTALSIDGLAMAGSVSIDFFAAPLLFKGFFPIASDRACETVSAQSGGTDSPYVFNDYTSDGMVLDFSIWRGADLQFVNLDKGDSNPLVLFNGSNNGLCQVFKEFQLSVSDSVGDPIEQAKSFITDIDHGQRVNRSPRSGVNYDLLPVRTYTESTDSAGNTALQTVLTRCSYAVTGAAPVWDYRGNNNAPTDLFTVHMAGYGEALASTIQKFQGSGVLELAWTLFPDGLIGETDRAIVDAYTEIDTPEKLYDAAKAFLVDNWGTYLDLVVATNTGDIGDLDFVVDPNAAQAFDFDGTTITINATTFNGDITTTGTVTLSNGAQINGILSDANGTTGILELT